MAQYGTIMVVDDNPAILTAAKITLQPHFENVITLSSPKDIISTLNQEEVNAILLDMNFTAGMNSGHDGLQWLENIHKLHPDVPVVLITAYADVKLAVTGLKMGAVDFVTKPWNNEELISSLKHAIDASETVVPLGDLETQHIQRVVDKCHGNITRASELLGISRQTLYSKIKK
jgi:DNA-binding NtrC family response regulator